VTVTRYCPSCGLERREGERFCRNCGHALGTGETALHAPPVATTSPLEAVGAVAPESEAPPNALPPPPAAPHPVVAGPEATHRLPPFKPLALGGGLAMVVAVFLPWISGGSSASALDIPLEAAWNIEAGDGPVKLGFAFVVLGGVGAGLAFVPRSVTIRRLIGSVGLALTLGFALQLYRSIDQAGGTVGDVIGAVGIGVYVALAGAVCLQISR
jgi:zinc-ribbon domain